MSHVEIQNKKIGRGHPVYFIGDIAANHDGDLSLTIDLLQSYPSEEPQIPKDATYCVRRTPEMSEITVAEIESRSAKYLYDKIRCLTGPYPRAYIRAGDGQNLFIEHASLAQD